MLRNPRHSKGAGRRGPRVARAVLRLALVVVVMSAAAAPADEGSTGDHREVADGLHLHEVIGGELFDRLCLVGGAPRPSTGSWSARPGETVRNNFGPEIGGEATTCRGSCGPGCSPNNCVDKGTFQECVDGDHYRLVQVYECHTQAGCRSHDDCLDRCAQRYPGEARSPGLPGAGDWVDEWLEQGAAWRPDRNFYTGECSSCCHIEAFRTYGWEGAGSVWKDGFESPIHPRDGVIRFEYTKEFPSQEEELHRCPERFRLECGEQGRGECVLDEVIVDVGPDRACIGVGDEQAMSAEVLGTTETGVEWEVVEGPGSISSEGVLEGTGEGEVRVRGTSVADREARDEAVVRVGTCACAFGAAVTGDTNRGRASGEFASFSTRGAAGMMASGGGGGAAGGDFLADLAGMMQKVGAGGEGSGRLAEQLLAKAGGQPAEAGGTPRGRTVTMSFIGGRGGPLSPGTFQLDLLSETSIGPGFSGPLPVSRVFVSTGEHAAEGGAPWMFLWEEGKPGRASLQVESYNGEWLVGRLDAELEGVEGLLVGGRRPRISVGLEFTAGAYNPLQMQNVCLFTRAMAASEE